MTKYSVDVVDWTCSDTWDAGRLLGSRDPEE